MCKHLIQLIKCKLLKNCNYINSWNLDTQQLASLLDGIIEPPLYCNNPIKKCTVCGQIKDDRDVFSLWLRLGKIQSWGNLYKDSLKSQRINQLEKLINEQDEKNKC